MSATDYRTLIDIHGGHTITLECSDGATVDLGIDGTTATFTLKDMPALIAKLRERMAATLGDGFNRFEFGWPGNIIELNYYDAGLLYDSLNDLVRQLG